MPQDQSPRLSHVGLYVSDVPKMIDFYTRVLGFVVSDGAICIYTGKLPSNPLREARPGV